jgi:hypothetical protein
MDLAALRARLDGLLAERDRHFPARDAANTAALRAALAEYVAALDALRPRPFEPDPRLVAEARAVAEQAVFVCGFMKGGTTLVLELLDGHPELTVLPGDSHMLDPATDSRHRREGDGHWVPVLVNPRGQRPFWYLGEDDRPYAAFGAWLEWWRAALPPGEPRSAFLAYVLALHGANPTRAAQPRAWVEKTPGNEGRVARILDWFPAARFVHVVRDPLENLASIRQLVRQRGWGWRATSAAANAWRLRHSLGAAAQNLRRLGPARYLVVRYEDVSADPRAEMKKVADFLGIAWDERLVTPSINGVASQANSMYRDRLGRAGAVLPVTTGRWRVELTRAEAALARRILAGAARRWGYDWRAAAPAARD